MAKKGGQLVVDIETDEDWKKLVEKEGLIVVDVYSDWCGPCTGMAGNLRKAKLEFGGETLVLATAKNDSITCLERFRGKSRPTWMFISNKRMIRLIFGTNAPHIMRILAEEVQKTKVAMESGTPRDGIDFDELTDEEQAIVDEENAIREEAERVESEEKERVIMERREDVATNLLDPLKEFNFVLLWPHVGNEAMPQVFNLVKETIMSVAAVSAKPVKHRLTDDNINEMLYYSSWEYSDKELEELKKGDCTALLFQAPMGNDEVNPTNVFRKKFYGTMECPPGDEDTLAGKLSKVIQVEREMKDEVDENDDDDADNEEQATDTEADDQKDNKFMEITIPALYVPENEKSKVLAMRILFPLVTVKFDLPEPEPIPPHLIVVFDAYKRNEALQIAADWPEATMRLGFFTSADPAEAKLVAKTVDQFQRVPGPQFDTKLVIQVSKEKSEPLLSYCVLGPVYVSPNTVVGEVQCAQFFPEDYDEPEHELEPEPVKKKKKKKSRAPKSSITSPSSDDKLDASEEGVEEEEVAEEEEEEEEEADADGDGDDEDDPLTGSQEPADITEEDKATST